DQELANPAELTAGSEVQPEAELPPEPESTPELEAGTSLGGIVDLESSAPAGYAIDRIWRGVTADTLRAADSDKNYWMPRITFGRLEKAEKEGLSALTAIEKTQLMRFMGWGGIHEDVRADHSRSSKNFQGESI